MARKRLTSLPEGLWSKLAELEAYVRQLDIVRGCGWTLAVAAIGLGLGLLADITVDLPLSVRIGMLAAACLATVGTAYGAIWRPWRRQRSVLDLAAVVERAHPQLKESLISCIELYDTTIPEAERGSSLMREMAAKQALQNVAPLDFCGAVSPHPAHRMALGGLLAWVLLLVPLLLPSSYRLLLARFLTPWQNLDRVTSFWFEVDRGDRVVVRGSDVTLAAHPKGDNVVLPATAQLHWVDSQGESDSRRVDYDASTGLYSTTIPHVMHGFQYYLSGAGNRSRTYRIQVVEAPAITSLKVEIQPPAYTGHPAKVLDGPAGEIAVLERSRMRWQLTFNKPLQAAEWHWQEDLDAAGDRPLVANEKAPKAVVKRAARPVIPFKLAADRLSATWDSVPEHGGQFRLVVRDEYGLTNDADGARQLVVTPDTAPTLTVAGSADAEVAQASDVIPVKVVATDDIGVEALELHYTIDVARNGVLKCELRDLGKPRVEHQFDLVLAEFHVRNGEVLSYRVRAADERPVPGPNETWSEQRFIHIDAKALPPGTQQLALDQEQLQKFLKQLRSDVTDQQRQAEQLKTQSARPSAPDAAEKLQRQVEQAADQQAKLQARLEQLAASLEHHPLLANLAEQTHELAAAEFAQAQAALSAAEQAQGAERTEKLQAAEAQLAKADEQLGALEQRLDKLAQLERDLLELNRLAAQADHLAERLKKLDQQQHTPSPVNETQQARENREQLQKAEQNQLLTQQRELTKQAAELLQKQPDLHAAAQQKQAEQRAQLAQRAEQLAPPQQALSEELRKAAAETARGQEALAARQDELQKQIEKLNEQVVKSDLPGVPPLDPAELKKPAEALRAGNLGAAAQEEERLAKRLEDLEQKLQAANQPNAEQAQKLAQETRDLQQELTRAQQAQDLSPQQEKQKQLAEMLSQLNEQIRQAGERTPPSPPGKEAAKGQPGARPMPESPASTATAEKTPGQQAQAAMAEAQRELAQGNPERSAEAGQKAADALRQLGPKSEAAPEGANRSPGSGAEGRPMSPRGEPAGTPGTSPAGGAVPMAASEQIAAAVKQLQDALATSPPVAPPRSTERKPAGIPESDPESAAGAPGSPAKSGDGAQGAPMGKSPAGESKPGAGPPGDPSSSGPAGSPSGTPQAASSGQAGSPGQGGVPGAATSNPEGAPQPGAATGAESTGPSSRQPSGLPGPSSPPSPSPLQAAAERLQQAAGALRQATAEWQAKGSGGSPQAGSPGGPPSGPVEGGPGGGGGHDGKGDAGAADKVDAANLARLKKRLASRKWGELPGTLQTEILQAAQKKPNSEYGELIRQYFKEIAKTQPATTAP
ncbi:MAG: hypothetical protein V4719_19520 [Planctomycetota bacterium]